MSRKLCSTIAPIVMEETCMAAIHHLPEEQYHVSTDTSAIHTSTNTHDPRIVSHTHLTLLPLALADLGRETSLDGRDGTSRAAGIARHKVESVLALVELRVWGAAGLAGHVFHYRQSLARYSTCTP